MFIENTQPSSIAMGKYYFHGGLTEVDKKEFEAHLKARSLKKGFDLFVESGRLKVIGGEPKLTKAMVEKTYDLELLAKFKAREDNSAVVKGAIKKQMDMLELPKEGE